MPNTVFTTTDCGQDQGWAVAEPPLLPGSFVEINGSTDLSTCVVGPNGACVHSIELVTDVGDLRRLNIHAQGPKGFSIPCTSLVFTDETGDSYAINFCLSEPKLHVLDYVSVAPGITRFTWLPYAVPAGDEAGR